MIAKVVLCPIEMVGYVSSQTCIQKNTHNYHVSLKHSRPALLLTPSSQTSQAMSFGSDQCPNGTMLRGLKGQTT